MVLAHLRDTHIRHACLGTKHTRGQGMVAKKQFSGTLKGAVGWLIVVHRDLFEHDLFFGFKVFLTEQRLHDIGQQIDRLRLALGQYRGIENG